MKKRTLLLAGLLALAACNNSAMPGGNTDQDKVDSIVKARVQAIQIQMEVKNDSIINALAEERADSIINAMKANAAAANTPMMGPTKPPPAEKKPATNGTKAKK